MRLRHVIHDSEGDAVPAVKPLARRIAQVDLFPKPREDYRRAQTKYGAFVSLFTIVVIIVLVLWEGVAYLRGRDAYDTDVTVDVGLSDDMQVNLDILFPRLPCHRLSVDVMDASGRTLFNYSGRVYKLPCGPYGLPMYKGSLQQLDSVLFDESADVQSECKRCPSAAFIGVDDAARAAATSACCNSCEAVMELYTKLGKPKPNPAYIPQCLDSLSVTARGCNVVGSLGLRKIPVTVIMGPRRTGTGYTFRDVQRMDSSHIIQKLRIGDESVTRFSKHGVAEPLSGHTSMAWTYLETRYYIKVVPTTYVTNKMAQYYASTYEYSAQWRKRAIIPGIGGAVPAVLFGFEPSPIQVNNIFQRPPMTHFLVQSCGIVGGLFVVLGFVDRGVDWVVTKMGW